MSTFKTALRMALAHPFYLLIYTVFISLMGVFIAASVSWNSSQLTEYKPYDANVIVVDRDGSDLSRALTKHLGSRFDLVTGVGDDTYDLADALSKSNSAKGSADCVFFIPEGFEDDLVAAARAGESLPKLDVTYGAGSMAAALSNTNASNPTLHTESTAPAPYTACMACDRFKRLQRLISTPFGTPVLPEV